MLEGNIEQIDAIPLPTGFVIPVRRSHANAPFSATGHFPILAFQKESEEPSYLATARDTVTTKSSRKYITTVKEGDSVVMYYDRNGEAKFTDDFQVLALRYDPMDFPVDSMVYLWRDLRSRAGSLDPTGPVYWLQYYPEMDPEFFEDAKEEVPYKLMRVLGSLNGGGFTTAEDCDEMMVEDFDDPFEDVEFSDEEDSLQSDSGVQSDSEAESIISAGFLEILDDITESSNEEDSLQEPSDDSNSVLDPDESREVENTSHSSYVHELEDSEICRDIFKELGRCLEEEGGAAGPCSEIGHSNLKGGT